MTRTEEKMEEQESKLKKGLTLLEAIIVIVIIGIIAAVAIPSLIKAKIEANEGTAAASLKTFNGVMARLKRNNYIGIGRVFCWGYGTETNSGKYVGLYYVVDAVGSLVNLIDVEDANADMRADGDTDAAAGDVGIYCPTSIGAYGAIVYLAPTTFRLQPKAGYWFGLMKYYDDDGSTRIPYDRSYAQSHYAIVAFPADYGSSGQTTFILNEGGSIYSMDFGKETGYLDTYPGSDPVKEGWEIAE